MVTAFSQVMSVHDGYLGGASIDVCIIVDNDDIHWHHTASRDC